jgi:hypothetical protein
MTTRRFNYTNQQRILPADLLVSIVDEKPPQVSVAATLGDYALPADAPVVLEAYADWTESRHDLGTVGNLKGDKPILLEEFDSADGIRFRIKVLGTGAQAGLILAEADRIAPVEEEAKSGGQSFVRIYSTDTGGECWRLRFDGSGPLLQFSSALADWRSLLRTDSVRALILPVVLRGILRRAVAEGPDEGDGKWVVEALRLGRTLARAEPPDDEDDDALEEWLDDACSAFGDRISALDSVQVLPQGADE